MSDVLTVQPDGRKLFTPPEYDHGGHYSHEWKSYWDRLSEAERQSLRDKARWEHMTLSAVAKDWGAIEPGEGSR